MGFHKPGEIVECAANETSYYNKLGWPIVITVWDESPEDVGWRVQGRPTDNQVTISEQLVSEGNEQADREQRMAAGAGDAEVAP